jgi:maleamate amidohydrolase
MARIWDDVLSEQDRIVIEKAGYAKRGAASWQSRGLGKRPAVIVIDMQQLTVGPNVPITEAIELYPTAMGQIAWQAMEFIKALLARARSIPIPIIYTRVIPRNYEPHHEALQIVAPLAPQVNDLIIDKNFASAFYATPLLHHLIRFGTDTVILVGNTTSGCVRATAIDAQQHGFSVLIPEECVFDRIEISHKASLLDLWMKYALVVPYAETEVYLKSLTTGEGTN